MLLTGSDKTPSLPLVALHLLLVSTLALLLLLPGAASAPLDASRITREALPGEASAALAESRQERPRRLPAADSARRKDAFQMPYFSFGSLLPRRTTAL